MLSQVAEVTGEKVTDIFRNMPMLHCLEYQSIWFAKNDYRIIRPDTVESKLEHRFR